MRISLGKLLPALVVLAWGGFVGSAVPTAAEVTLPHIFSDNMVLQRGRPIPIWGWAAKGEEVTVSLGCLQRRVGTLDQAQEVEYGKRCSVGRFEGPRASDV